MISTASSVALFSLAQRSVTLSATHIDMDKYSKDKDLSKVEVGRVTELQCLEVALTQEDERGREKESECESYIYMCVDFLAQRRNAALNSFRQNTLAVSPHCNPLRSKRNAGWRAVR